MAEAVSVASKRIPKEVATNVEVYTRNAASQRLWNVQASGDLDFYNGIHWTDEQKEKLAARRQDPSTIEVMYQIVDQAVSMLTARNPRYSGTARESSDREWAHVASSVMQWIWQESDGSMKAAEAIRDYYVMGRGALLAYIDPDGDYGRGEVRFDSIDPRDVYPDPNSKHPLLDDAQDIVIRRLFTESVIKQRYGNIDLTGVPKTDNHEYGTTHTQTDVTQGASGATWTNDDTVQVHPDQVMKMRPDTYEILERYTKEMRPHFRFMDPISGREEVFHQDRYDERRADPAYLIERQGDQLPMLDPVEIVKLDQIYNTLGPVYHLTRVAPQVDPQSGQPVEQPPQMLPGPEQPGSNDIPGSTTRLFPVTVGNIIDKGMLPVVEFQSPQVKVVASVGGVKLLYKPTYLPTGHYPIVVIPNTHNRNPYCISDVHRTIPLQKQINKINSLILAHLANSSNLKVFYPEDSITDPESWEKEWMKAGAAFIPYNAEFGQRGGVEIVAPPQISAALFAHLDRHIGLMERIFGVYSTGQGDPSAQAETARGNILTDEAGLRRMAGKLKTIYASLSRLGQVSFEFAQDIYTVEKTMRIVNPQNGKQEEVTINQQLPQADYTDSIVRINDIAKGKVDLIVMAGSTLPSNRWALLQEYKEMFQLGIVDDKAVLENSEIPDADQILERTGMIKQLQQALQGAQEEVKNLKGDLQTANRAAVNALQRLEVEKGVKKLDESVMSMQKSAELFDARLNMEAEKITANMKANASTNGKS